MSRESPGEIQRLLDMARGRRNSPQWALALRQGEALGLRYASAARGYGPGTHTAAAAHAAGRPGPVRSV